METVALGPRRALLKANLVGGVAFVVAGLLLIVLDPSTKNWLVCAMTTVFFGGLSIVFARQLLDSRPPVIVDDAGVLDRRLGAEAVPWDQILDASVPKMLGPGAAIALRLRDSDAVFAKLGPMSRRLAQSNKRLGFHGLVINVTGFGIDPHTLADLITKEAECRRLDAASAPPPTGAGVTSPRGEAP